ncbi:hypothetical protein BC829DRAFT_448516 [Chytridium lagenaria]|nr:hypothetical protein BC829DRAFT_448516 [Chytridium lagenaria]
MLLHILNPTSFLPLLIYLTITTKTLTLANDQSSTLRALIRRLWRRLHGVAALVAQGYTTSDIFTSSPASPTSSLPTISPSNTPSFSATFYTPPPSVSSLNSVSADGASTVMMASSQDIAIAGDTRDAGGSTATLKNPKVTFGGDGASVGTRTQFDTLHIALYGVFLALFA